MLANKFGLEYQAAPFQVVQPFLYAAEFSVMLVTFTWNIWRTWYIVEIIQKSISLGVSRVQTFQARN